MDLGLASTAIAWPSLAVSTKELKETWGRAPRGVEQVRVPAWDEDAATLAIEAGQAALACMGTSGESLEMILLAGVDAPGTVVAEALGAHAARLLELSGPASAMEALLSAFSARGPALVVVATMPRARAGTEARLGEGAGAAAFLLLPGGAGRLIASSSAVRHVPGAQRRFADGSPRVPLSDVDDVGPVRDALARLETPDDPAFAVGSIPRGSRLSPKRETPDPSRSAGGLGDASAAFALALALREGVENGEWVLVAEGTQERGLALALRVQGEVQHAPLLEDAAQLVTSVRALQESRAFAAVEDVPDSPMGAYVPVGSWVEDLPARLRLEAQRCAACDRTLFPPRGACPACRGSRLEKVSLPRDASIHSVTRIGRGGAPSEFALEQQQTGAYWVAVVEWPEAGVKVTARLTDVPDAAAPAIGHPVRAVVRRLFEQEGASRYGIKFKPARDAA